MDKWNKLKEESREYIRDFRREKFCELDIVPDKRFIGVSFLGCQHIGNVGTDYDRMENDAKLINDTNDMYCVLCGDAYDNFIIGKILTAIINAKTAPTDQIKLFTQYVRMLGSDNILGCISGNHEFWTKKQAGIDVLGMMCKQENIFYTPHEMITDLKVGDIYYRLKTRHQYRYNSTLNLTHCVKRMYDMGQEVFDVGVLAHHHINEIGTFERHGKTRVALRVDSYKVADVYGRERGSSDSRGNMPGVIFDSKTKRMIIYQDVSTGCEMLAGMNGNMISEHGSDIL